MSMLAVRWALTQAAETSSAKFVLVVLAEAANDKPWTSKFGRAWPPLTALRSIAAICESTMQDRKTVIANLDRLARAGLIAPAGTDGRTNQIQVFRVLVTSTENGTGELALAGAENGTGTESGTVPVFPPTGTSFPANQSRFSVQPVPKTGHGTIRNPKGNRKEPKERADKPAALARPDDVSERVWKDWCAHRKGKRAAVTETVMSHARAQAALVPMSLEQYLTVWCARGSQGLEAAWLKPNERAAARGASFKESRDYGAGVNTDGTFSV